MNHFFAYVYRLRFIQRWSLMRNAVPESVAEHSFQVALLAYTLCTISRAVFGNAVPTERVVTPAGPASKAMDRRERLLRAGFERVSTAPGDAPVTRRNARRYRMSTFSGTEGRVQNRVSTGTPTGT